MDHPIMTTMPLRKNSTQHRLLNEKLEETNRGREKWDWEKPAVLVWYSDCSTSPYKPVRASQHTEETRSRRMGQCHFFRTAWAWLQFARNSVVLTEKTEFHDGRDYKGIRVLPACFPALLALIFAAIKNAVRIFSVWPAIMLVKLVLPIG